MQGQIERRAGVDLRATGRKLVGYAAIWNSPAQIGSFTETIKAGAFARSLSGSGDILALVDHDGGKLLARRSSGTLRLAEDSRGLRFEIDLANTQLANDVLALAERRDLGGMSFGFSVPPQGDAWPTPSTRELRSVDLAEISVIHAFPAYRATSVEARRLAEASLAAHQRRLYVLGLT